MTMFEGLMHPLRLPSWRLRNAPWIAALLLTLCFGSQPALAANDFPNRPITMIVPFPAGGPADIIGRLYAHYLARLSGQPVIVDNRGGAAGVIGMQVAAHATPNGYTILFGTTSTMVINELTMKNLPYDTARDFTQIGLVAIAPHVLAVRASLPAKTPAELIALAKKDPGKYTFASSGTGGIVQMGGELFKYRSGIDILHVPYKGGGPATLALLAGEVDMTVNDLTTLKSFFESGKLRPLAVAHTSRLKHLPNVPTFAELGMPNLTSSTWWDIAVPAKTPADIQARLKEFHAKIIANPEYVARLADTGSEPLVMTPAQSAAFIQNEVQKWKAVVTAAKIQPE
jgi:tripartite-type tricarboxylate transporter receptor subunit TctC